MGCYDTVRGQCPKCTENIRIQTKAGRCQLATFNINAVPVELAVSLDGESTNCPRCGTIVWFSLPFQPKRVAMQIVLKDPKAEVEEDEDESAIP